MTIQLERLERTLEEEWSRDLLRYSRCRLCGGRYSLAWYVSDETWLAVFPGGFRGHVCLGCFDVLAEEAEVEYASEIKEIHFAGVKTGIIFRTRKFATRGAKRAQ